MVDTEPVGTSDLGTGKLTVATVQAESVAGDIAANVQTACILIDRAAAAGARLVVFPELFLGGYLMDSASVDPEDDRLSPLAQTASAAGVVALIGGATATRGQSRTIATFAIDAQIRCVYHKQHLSGPERDSFTAGDDLTIIELDGWNLGLAVCYDGCFPEHARAYADAGAEVYVASVAYYTGTTHRRDLYHRARALDNGMFVAVSGLVGVCNVAEFSGGSAIYDPEGRPMDAVPDAATGIAVATLDRSAMQATRAAHPMATQRRTSCGSVRKITVG